MDILLRQDDNLICMILGHLDSLATLMRLSKTCRRLHELVSRKVPDLRTLDSAYLLKLQLAATAMHIENPEYPLIDASKYEDRSSIDSAGRSTNLAYMWCFHVNPRIVMDYGILQGILLRSDNEHISRAYNHIMSLFSDDYTYLVEEVFHLGKGRDATRNLLLLLSCPAALQFASSDKFLSTMQTARITREVTRLEQRRQLHNAKRLHQGLAWDGPLRLNLWDVENDRQLHGAIQERPKYDAEHNEVTVDLYLPPERDREIVTFDWCKTLSCFKARSRIGHRNRSHPYTRSDRNITLHVSSVH